MTKRNGTFNENAAKKLKVDDNFDALWGEDPDIDDVDDCLLLATQICEKEQANTSLIQRNNVSILPNYSFFKNEENIAITSTQTNFHKPASSKSVLQTNYNQKSVNGYKNDDELQKKVDNLQAQCEAKEGEVSILRSQLKQLKTNTEAEQTKKEKEWLDKMRLATKELNCIKSELEFKNLEIVNLKNKVTEVSKNYMENTLNSSLCIKPKDQEVGLFSLKLDATLEARYPLKDIISSDIFSTPRREHFPMNVKYHLSSTFNMKLEQDEEIIKHSRVIAQYNDFKLDCIFPYISVLISLNQVDLDSDLAVESVDKILCVTFNVLQSFLRYLRILEDTIQSETVRQMDIMYLDRKLNDFRTNSSIFGNEGWYDKEIGVKARQAVVLIGAILPYNSYLRVSVLRDAGFSPNNNYSKFLSDDPNLNNLFTLLLSIIIIIGKLRLSEQCIGFLCSSVIYLTRIVVTEEFSKCFLFVYKIVKEIVFTRPSMKVLEYLADFFKLASLNVDFVRELCKLPRQRNLRVNTKEGILYYNKDSCVLQVFTALYVDSFKGHCEDTKRSLTMLQFINQSLNSNIKWIYFEENNHCDCVCKIINLSLKIVHETTKYYKFERRKKLQNTALINDYKVILKFSIDVLHTIMFKYLDLINKYSVDAQYKFIVKTIIDSKEDLAISDQDYETLKNLILLEETQIVNKPLFDKVPLWS